MAFAYARTGEALGLSWLYGTITITAAYAGLAGSTEVDVSMLTVGVQNLRDLRHPVGARG